MKKNQTKNMDVVKELRKISREEEIYEHGKQIINRTNIHKSKKKYDRKSKKDIIQDYS